MSDRLLCAASLEKEGTGSAFSGRHVPMVLWLFSGELPAHYVGKYSGELSFP